MITDVPGIRVGHWTDTKARTGCTVVLFPEGTVASGEVRGGAPATREVDLLAPERLVTRIDAVLLTGGSAFGLAAADGVMRFCEEHGMGFPTGGGTVPIVVALGLFDLLVGDGSIRPGPAEGYAACTAAAAGPFETGAVGAGTGATVGNVGGPEAARPGGIGTAVVRHEDLVVGALVAVNAYGDLDGRFEDPVAVGAPAFSNTTLAVVATNAALDKTGCFLVAQGGQDGFARALAPSHTRFDGDAVVAVAVGGVEAEVDQVRLMAVRAVEQAIRSAVG